MITQCEECELLGGVHAPHCPSRPGASYREMADYLKGYGQGQAGFPPFRCGAAPSAKLGWLRGRSQLTAKNLAVRTGEVHGMLLVSISAE